MLLKRLKEKNYTKLQIALLQLTLNGRTTYYVHFIEYDKELLFYDVFKTKQYKTLKSAENYFNEMTKIFDLI